MSHPGEPLFQGLGVSKGVALGPVWCFHPHAFNSTPIQKFRGVDEEITRFRNAQKAVIERLSLLIEKTKREVGEEESMIFDAHQTMLQDEEIVSPILFSITEGNKTAEEAVMESFRVQIQIFESADSDYMRERALDLRDLEGQLLGELNPQSRQDLSKLPKPVILVAEDLTPSQTILLDRKNVLGLVTEKGGETSHSAIIARTLGIPAVSGITGIVSRLKNDTEIAIDGSKGELFALDPQSRSFFQSVQEQENKEKNTLKTFHGKPSMTQDLRRISLYANIGNDEDAKAALSGDAEGVGLFRTEFLFMERKTAPTLDEQINAYRSVLERMAPKEVVIRTLDVGGDKPIEYIKIAKEENPFLGVRAIRYCFSDLELFKTQLKALLLANEWGNLSIMTPMVSRASEAVRVKELVEECHRELKQSPDTKARYKAKPYKLGTMVEIPSLIFEMRELKEAVSFISVGTNDLTQYALAVDRMNPAMTSFYSPYTLGFIRMMKHLADSALEVGLNLGICGELGGKDEFLPLWLAMGYQKLSMIPSEVLPKRALLSKLTLARCQILLKEVLALRNEFEVKSKLKDYLEREKQR